MTTPEFRTLAYNKSPKTLKRTTFQDELQAAVSARANKSSTNQFFYDHYEEDEDDFLNKLIKSRKKKTDAFKASKNKAQFNTFQLSDDEGRDNETKKVSFLKTQRNISFQNNTTESESQDNEAADSCVISKNDLKDSFSSTPTKNASGEMTQDNDGFVNNDDTQTPAQNSGKYLSSQQSSSSLLDLTLSQTLESSIAHDPGVNGTVQISTSDVRHMDSSERLPPRPKPRQRTLGLGVQTIPKPAEESGVQDVSRPPTSSTSVHLSSDTSSNVAVTSCSPHCLEEDYSESQSLSKLSSRNSEQSQGLPKSAVNSGSRDGYCSASHKDGNECPEPDPVSPVPKTPLEITTQSSPFRTTKRSQSVCSRKVESKYLGTLKILDLKVSAQESEPLAANSLRASVYQDWLKKKKEHSKETVQLKQKEELLKENQKKTQETKEEDAAASYEAWKKTKVDYLKAKAKEKQDKIRKEQQITQEKEEKKQSAKQVFEKWKSEHDRLLKEKHREQHETENKLEKNKREQDEERRTNCKSAFSNWCEKKKNVLHEKHKLQQKTLQNKMDEEQYMKEERDQRAVEMYESWLVRKDLEQKRQRKERIVQEILSYSPPPPWSPPNKTVPFRK